MDWKVAAVRTSDHIPRTSRNTISNFQLQSRPLFAYVSNYFVEEPPNTYIDVLNQNSHRGDGKRNGMALTSRCRSVRVRLRDGGRGSPGRKRVGTGTTSRLLRYPGGGR